MLRKLMIAFVLPIVAYTGVALFITYPLVTQLSTHVIGNEFTDSFEFVRTGWWQQYALLHGLSPFYQSLFAYPDGFFSTIQWIQPLVYWPISLLNFFVSPVSAFNVWILTELVLDGLSVYWLCLAIPGGKRPLSTILGALLGGLVFMIFPTVQGHLSVGHANMIGVYGLPPLAWALYCASGSAEGGISRKNIALGALGFCVLLLSNYATPVYLIFPLFLLFTLYVVLPSIIRRQPFPWTAVRGIALIAASGLLLSLPFYLPLVAESLSPHGSDFYNSGEVVHYSTDLLAFATLSPYTPWTAFADNPTSRWIIDADGVEGAAYLGLVVVILAGVALFTPRQAGQEDTVRARLWAFVAVGSAILSLGPVLKWAGYPVKYSAADFSGTIAMPWALFQNLPVFNLGRTPGRINLTTALCVGILAALGLNFLLRRIKLPALQIALAVLLGGAVIAEYQEFWPFPTTNARLPTAFYELADRSDVRAVLDVPLNSITGTKEALFEQTAHLKPLIAGYVARATPVSQDKLLLLSSVAMGSAYRVQDDQPLDADSARAVLKANGVDVLVYHWKFIDKTPALRWAASAFKSLYEDDQTAIFEVPAPQKSVVPSAIAYDGMGRAAPEGSAWFGDNSALIIYAPDVEDQHLTLNLTPLLTQRQVKVSVDGEYQGTWLLSLPSQQIDLWLQLAPGYHHLQFTFPEGCTPVPVAPECLVQPYRTGADCLLQTTPVKSDQELCVSAGITALSIADAGSMSYHTHPVQLAQGMALQGFRLPTAIGPDQKLTIETDWQTTQSLQGDYHYFVHVYGPDGKLAAQYDSIPDQGRFPTTKWADHQHWKALDSIDIPRKPGIYQVYVGWYRYPDLTRLGVQGNGPHAADGLVYLGDFSVTNTADVF